MRRTFPGAAALTTAAVAALFLSACTVDGSDSGSTTGADTSTDASATADPDDPATLGLAVGDCVSDLGAQETEAATSSAAATTTSGAAKGSAARKATTTSATTATSATASDDATDADSADAADTGYTDLDGDGYPDEPTDLDGTGGTGDTDSAGVLDDTVPDTATGIAKTDCDQPHVGEVFEQRELDNQVLFPGQKMNRLTAAVCTGDAFEDYIGAPFATSVFDVISYAPSKESWANGDRTVTCVVTDPSAGYIPGTLKDAGY